MSTRDVHGVQSGAPRRRWEGHPAGSLQIIGFDMGGTSTDVSRYAGSYEHVFETTTAGVTIQAPQLDVNTVAAGAPHAIPQRGVACSLRCAPTPRMCGCVPHAWFRALCN